MTQDFRNFGGNRYSSVDGQVISSTTEPVSTIAGNNVLRNTYLLLAISMIPAVAGAWLGTMFFPIKLFAQSPILFSLIFLGAFYGMIFAIERNNRSATGIVLLEIFTAMLGFMSGPLLMMAGSYQNGGSLIAFAFGGTAAIFFTMASIASVIKRPLSGLGNFLAVGAIVLLIGIVASIFVQSSMLSLALTCGILLFSTLAMLWRINMAYTDGNANYISLTLGLVIDLYNIFTTLLRLLMVFSGRSND